MKNEQNVEQLFPVAYGLKSADAGKGLCYVGNTADAIKKVTQTLPVENGKVIFPWPVIRDVINLLWSEFKRAAKDCDEKEVILKRPTGLLGILPAVASWLGLRIWD
jgi:hypothetical protein